MKELADILRGLAKDLEAGQVYPDLLAELARRFAATAETKRRER